ncbi:hypothetical protein D046_6618A, partial [Vibrio parahaemolyticus V-223/04]
MSIFCQGNLCSA